MTVKSADKVLLKDVTGQITSGYYAIMARARFNPVGCLVTVLDAVFCEVKADKDC